MYDEQNYLKAAQGIYFEGNTKLKLTDFEDTHGKPMRKELVASQL